MSIVVYYVPGIPLLIKTDAEGNALWTRTYGGSEFETGYSVVQAADGGYLIVGTTSSYGNGTYDAWLVRTDANGDTLWTRTYGGCHSDEGYAVRQTQDGGFVISGETVEGPDGNCGIWLVKTDATGAAEWTKTLGGLGPGRGPSVVQTRDLGYAVTGCTQRKGMVDAWLVKTDARGNTEWSCGFGGDSLAENGIDEGYSVLQTIDGAYVVLGATASSGDGGTDVWLIRAEPEDYDTDDAGDASRAIVGTLRPAH